MVRHYKIICIAAALFLLCSCLDQIVEKPTFILKDVSLTVHSMKELDVLFTVDVRNPNRYSLYVDSLEYHFSLNNHEAARGRYSESFEVQPASVKEITVPLTIGINNLGSNIKTLIHGEGIPYRIEGTLHLKVLWGSMAIPFVKEGSFKIKL